MTELKIGYHTGTLTLSLHFSTLGDDSRGWTYQQAMHHARHTTKTPEALKLLTFYR